MKRGIVFVSCGQWADNEKALGHRVATLVEELTPYEAYFAERVSSLDGLSNNILRKLNEAVGFIAIMHPRGSFDTPDGRVTRASVWIEQEIAIAAHLVHVHQKKINVQAYIHADIKLEGLREKLHLNPVKFTSEPEILDHLRETLPKWELLTADDVAFSIVGEHQGHTNSDRLPGYIKFNVTNGTASSLREYHIDVEIPKEFVLQDSQYPHEVASRNTDTHRFFRFPALHGKVADVYPTDTKEVWSFTGNIPYEAVTGELPRKLVRARLYYGNAESRIVHKSMDSLFDWPSVRKVWNMD